MLIFQALVSGYRLNTDLFNEYYNKIMGGFWQQYPNARKDFKDNLLGVLQNPFTPDGKPRGAHATVPSSDAGNFDDIARNFNKIFKSGIMQVYKEEQQGGNSLVMLYIDPSTGKDSIQASYDRLSNAKLRASNLALASPIVPLAGDEEKNLGGSSIPLDSRISRNKPQEQAPPAAQPDQASKEKPAAAPETQNAPAPALSESPSHKWEQHPNDINAWRYYLDAIAGIAISGFEKSILLPKFIPSESDSRSMGALINNFWGRFTENTGTLSQFGVDINAGSSFERELCEAAIQAKQIEGMKAYMKKELKPVLDSQAAALFGMDLTRLGGLPFKDQQALLMYGKKKRPSSETYGSFYLPEEAKATLASKMASRFNVPREITVDLINDFFFANNNLRSSGSRALLELVEIEKHPEIMKRLVAANGGKKLSINYWAAIWGEEQGPIKLNLGHYLPPESGPEGVLKYKEEQREMVARLRDSEAANKSLPAIPFSELQNQLVSGRIKATTNYLELVKLGIIHYDSESNQPTFSPYRYAWHSGGAWQHSDSAPASGVVTGGTGPVDGSKSGFNGLLRTRMSGGIISAEKGRMLDEVLYSADRKMGAEVTEQSKIRVMPRFAKPPLYNLTKGIPLTADVSFISAAEGGGKIAYFSKGEKVKLNVNVSKVTMSGGKEQLEELSCIPYAFVDKNGKRTKVSLKPDMQRIDAEFELTYEYNRQKGTVMLNLVPMPGKKLVEGTTYQIDLKLEVPTSGSQNKFTTAYGGYRLYVPVPPKPVAPAPKPEEKLAMMDVQLPAFPMRVSPAEGVGEYVYSVPSGYKEGKVNFEQTALPLIKHIRTNAPETGQMLYFNGKPDTLHSIDFNADIRMVHMNYMRNSDDEEMVFITKMAPEEQLSELKTYQQLVPCKVGDDRKMTVDWSLIDASERPPKGSPEEKLQGTYIGALPPRDQIAENDDGTYSFRPLDMAFEYVGEKSGNPLLSTVLANYASSRTAAQDAQGPYVSDDLPSMQSVPKRCEDDLIAVGVPEYLVKNVLSEGFKPSPGIMTFSVGHRAEK